jgi:ribosomal protein S18 acetylase RimI-like enzyme
MFLGSQRSRSLPITITVFERQHRRATRELIFRSHLVHAHLDWQETDEWLNNVPPFTWVAWKGTRAVGLASFSEPLGGATWLRVAAADYDEDVAGVMRLLWEHALPDLRAAHATHCAVLLINDWLEPHMRDFGFGFHEKVITLKRSTNAMPDEARNPFMVRAFTPADMSSIITLDQAAFSPPWQMTDGEIRVAERMAVSCTVAVYEECVVGYQLSTIYFDGGHLARLAVAPDMQGRGVGKAILSDLIYRFGRRSIYAVSVNTQETNIQSQRLYERLGFRRNGYDLPVWMTAIASP